MNPDGWGDWSDIWNFSIEITSISKLTDVVPNQYKLYQNYPNPFNPLTIIRYAIPRSGNVSIILYDLLGTKIKVLVDGYHSAGMYITEFRPTSITSGIYLYRIKTYNYNETRKMIFLK
ncbi:MAG: T9SS type A sorting domain-containing protein [Ignavibacteriaceae bacterium]